MNNPNNQLFVIFDLDNCLSDDSARIWLIDWSEPDPTKRYEKYHEACWKDKPGNHEVFNCAVFAAGASSLFITGRPESVRGLTTSWIAGTFGFCPNEKGLLMRPEGCDLTSVALKRALLNDWMKTTGAKAHNIFIAYDDHPEIVEMYKKDFGIPAQVLKIHDLDAYRDSDSIPRTSKAEGVRAIAADLTSFDELGPVQGARPRESASDILRAMAATFDERNAVYRDNSRMIPKLIKALFPNGVPRGLVEREEFHLFELILVKLARFASADLAHVDSIHDIAPYCAMIEAILKEREVGDPL